MPHYVLADSIWQAIDSLSQGPPPRFEYELPSCTGFPFRRLRLSVRELHEELLVRSGRPETGRSAWLTVQFSGSEAVEKLPTSQDGRRWKTLALAE